MTNVNQDQNKINEFRFESGNVYQYDRSANGYVFYANAALYTKIELAEMKKSMVTE